MQEQLRNIRKEYEGKYEEWKHKKEEEIKRTSVRHSRYLTTQDFKDLRQEITKADEQKALRAQQEQKERELKEKEQREKQQKEKEAKEQKEREAKIAQELKEEKKEPEEIKKVEHKSEDKPELKKSSSIKKKKTYESEEGQEFRTITKDDVERDVQGPLTGETEEQGSWAKKKAKTASFRHSDEFAVLHKGSPDAERILVYATSVLLATVWGLIYSFPLYFYRMQPRATIDCLLTDVRVAELKAKFDYNQVELDLMGAFMYIGASLLGFGLNGVLQSAIDYTGLFTAAWIASVLSYLMFFLSYIDVAPGLLH